MLRWHCNFGPQVWAPANHIQRKTVFCDIMCTVESQMDLPCATGCRSNLVHTSTKATNHRDQQTGDPSPSRDHPTLAWRKQFVWDSQASSSKPSLARGMGVLELLSVAAITWRAESWFSSCW